MNSTIRRAFLALGFLLTTSHESNGAPGVSIATLQSHLQSKNSPLTPFAQEIYDAGERENIDPRLLVAIAGQETSYGLHICTPYNAWNMWHTHEWCDAPYNSWVDGINDTSFRLHKYYLFNPKEPKDTIEKIGNKYCERECLTCPKGCPTWIKNVTKIYTELGGCLDDLTFGAPEVGKCANTTKPEPICTPIAVLTSLNFGEVAYNSCSAPKEVTIQNQDGCNKLEGSATTAPPFMVVGNSSFSLKSREAGTIQVSFCPSAPGEVTQALNFETNRGNANTLLKGNGQATLPEDGWHCCTNIKNPNALSNPAFCGFEVLASFITQQDFKASCESYSQGEYYQGRCPNPFCGEVLSCCLPPEGFGIESVTIFGSQLISGDECETNFGVPGTAVVTGRCS